MKTTLKALALACFAFGSGATSALADDAPVVVELFTSQGCSSCPPADEILAQMATREDVIALALHVDYWDYIGWADSFGDADWTARQYRYAQASGANTVYTPQFVVGGSDFVVGARSADLAGLIAAHDRQPDPVVLSVQIRGGIAQVAAEWQFGTPRAAVVQVVSYIPMEHVEISRGENAGRILSYANIVTDWQVVARWDGRSPLSLRLPQRAGQSAVVIVQTEGQGPILAAAHLGR